MKVFSNFWFRLAFALLLSGTLFAEGESRPRKRGGFSTPTPAPKKSASDESTPKPKKSTSGESTPSPQKKTTPSDEAAPSGRKAEPSDTSAKSPMTSDAGPTESTPKPKKSTSAESTPAPHKKKTPPPDELTPVEPKADASAASAKTPKTAEPGNEIATPPKPEHAPAATLEAEELAEFAAQPPRVQALITAALALTKLNLTYTYGSDDPAQGGMDCSGTMAYVLRAQGFKDVPRDSSSQYVWARKGGPFFAVVSKSAESFEFKDLQPGDLLFWTGTYETSREIPISHVMLYLGIEKKTKKRVMFGSSDGRSYAGIQRWGVSVFDFKMPNGTAPSGERTKVDFVGYGRIPELREPVVLPLVAAEKPPNTPIAPVATPAKPRVAAKEPSSTPTPRKKKRSN